MATWLLLACVGTAGVLASPVAAASCDGVQTSIISCSGAAGSSNGIWDLLLEVIDFLAAGVGILAVGAVIVGGIIYTTSNGDSQRTVRGVSVIRNAVIGTFCFAFMYAFMQFLIPGGLLAQKLPAVNPVADAPPSSSSNEGSSVAPESGNPSPAAPKAPGTGPGHAPKTSTEKPNPSKPKAATAAAVLGEDPIESLKPCPYTRSLPNIDRLPYIAHYDIPNYYMGDSTEGDLRACADGYHWADQDFTITHDGVVVNSHWRDLRTAGYLPWSTPAEKADVANLTWAEVSKLSIGNGYRIRSAYQVIKQTCELGLNVAFEAKEDYALWMRVSTWKQLAGYARKFCGADWQQNIHVGTLCKFGRNYLIDSPRRIIAARAAGFVANLWSTCH